MYLNRWRYQLLSDNEEATWQCLPIVPPGVANSGMGSKRNMVGKWSSRGRLVPGFKTSQDLHITHGGLGAPRSTRWYHFLCEYCKARVLRILASSLDASPPSKPPSLFSVWSGSRGQAMVTSGCASYCQESIGASQGLTLENEKSCSLKEPSWGKISIIFKTLKTNLQSKVEGFTLIHSLFAY